MKPILRTVVAIAVAMLVTGATALAQRGGGGTRSSARQSVNRNDTVNRNNNVNNNTNVNRNTNVNNNTNVNRNTNINRDIDIDRDIDVDVDHRYGGCCYNNGWGTAAAIATTAAVTAAVVGSVVNTLPPSCQVVVQNGFTYQQCGSTWYQPQMVGGSTTYVVIDAP
jgi:hypothetical protein